MWYKYKITFEHINGSVIEFVALSEDDNNLIGVAQGWECNYICKKLLKVEYLGEADED